MQYFVSMVQAEWIMSEGMPKFIQIYINVHVTSLCHHLDEMFLIAIIAC